MKLTNRFAIITGAGRGLGRAIAVEMSRQGAGVMLFSRTEKEVKRTVDEILSSGGTAFACPGDLSDPDDISRLTTETLERFPTINILVNNAAVIGPANISGTEAEQDWQTTLNINLTGTYSCTREVIRIMRQKNPDSGGKIINIVSGLGNMAFPRFCAYAVSKAGLIQMTRSLAVELEADNIQVNAIDPGLMDTAMQEKIRAYGKERLGRTVYEQFCRFQENGELKNPQRVAQLAVFLASGDNRSCCNGQIGTLSDYENLGWIPG